MTNNTELATTEPTAAALERVLIKGDIGKLSDEQRVYYYRAVCESVGLNPLTQPFNYLVLKGKTVLYANKACTDQLRTNHKISIYQLDTKTEDGIYQVTAYARNAEGREDADLGAVSISNLKGEDLANAKMKATTKAKRRVTLSICGLGMLDETEVESISAEDRQARAVQDYISPAMPAQNAPTGLSVQAKGTGSKDNISAIGELIRDLRTAGIAMPVIQQRMKALTGCEKRSELNDGQAVVVIEEFESWLDVLDDPAYGTPREDTQ
jgi:hypothetical protein